MSKARPYARHILLRGSVYYFRIAIPLDLRGCLGLSEVRLSLRTGYARKAAVIARMLAAKGQALFNLIRSRKMAGIDKRELNLMVRQYFHQHLDEYEDHVIENGPDTPERRESSLEELAVIREHTQECLSLHQYDRVKSDALRFVTDNGLEVAEDTPEFRRVAHELLKANMDMLSILYHRQQGDYSKEDELLDKYSLDSLVLPPVPQAAAVEEEQGVRLFELIEKYCARKIRLNKWTGRGVTENPKNYNVIKFVLGDMPVKEITEDTAFHLFESLHKLPPRLSSKKYEGMTLDDLTSMEHQKTLAPKTINSRMEDASSLMRRAKKWGDADVDPFEGIRVRDMVSDEERRLPFSTEDLRTIFNPGTFLPHCEGSPSRYWLPVLALYTGARLEELAQLHVEDVFVEDGVLVLDINDNGDKRLKNKNARRVIPVHNLVRDELGFEAYVDEQRKVGETQVFSELPYIQKRYGHKATKDFSSYLTNLEIGPKKTFHSFRHGFIKHLQNKDVRERVIASMTGHGANAREVIPKNYTGKHGVEFLMEKVLIFLDFDVVIPKWSMD